MFNIKYTILTTTLTLSIVSCNNKKETTVEPETPVTCFNSQYNGTYVGSGFTLSSPYTSGTLTISKTNCQSANFALLTNTSSNINELVSQLVQNSNGGFNGKLSNGSDVTLILGSTLQVNAVGSFTFNGTRKP